MPPMNHFPHRPHHPGTAALALAVCLAGMPQAYAQDVSSGTVAQLRAEIDALRADQAERELRLQRLESALQRIAGDPAPATTAPVAAPTPAASTATALAAGLAPAPTLAGADAAASRLKVSGDLRLRGQADWSDDDSENRGSMQVRGRLGATFAVNDRITVGARLATGD